MILRNGIISAAVCAFVIAGCGKNDSSKPAEQGTSDQRGADGTPQGGNGGGSNSGGQHKPVPAVDFHKLQALLPTISGYTKGEPQGASMSMGEWNYSTASAEYTNGDSRITVTIFDYAYIESLLAAYKMKFSFENEDGYTKTVTVSGYPGWETWSKKDRTANCTALAGDRFVIVAEGQDQNNADLVRGALAGMNLKSLESTQ